MEDNNKGYLNKGYLECGLPDNIEILTRKMQEHWDKLDAGIETMWDGDYCELQSELEMAEMDQLITSEQAWYLREKYLKMVNYNNEDFEEEE